MTVDLLTAGVGRARHSGVGTPSKLGVRAASTSVQAAMHITVQTALRINVPQAALACGKAPSRHSLQPAQKTAATRCAQLAASAASRAIRWRVWHEATPVALWYSAPLASICVAPDSNFLLTCCSHRVFIWLISCDVSTGYTVNRSNCLFLPGALATCASIWPGWTPPALPPAHLPSGPQTLAPTESQPHAGTGPCLRGRAVAAVAG